MVPFHSKQWHLDMESFAFESAVNMDPDHEALLLCWPMICADHGWSDDADVSREARQRFLQKLLSERTVRVIGGKAAYSKWWSIYNEAKQGDSSVATKLFLLIGL